jgi:hypothetical protein
MASSTIEQSFHLTVTHFNGLSARYIECNDLARENLSGARMIPGFVWGSLDQELLGEEFESEADDLFPAKMVKSLIRRTTSRLPACTFRHENVWLDFAVNATRRKLKDTIVNCLLAFNTLNAAFASF